MTEEIEMTGEEIRENRLKYWIDKINHFNRLIAKANEEKRAAENPTEYQAAILEEYHLQRQVKDFEKRFNKIYDEPVY